LNTTDAYIARLLAEAPPLTDQQRNRLAELLRPVRVPTKARVPMDRLLKAVA
jgi:hypothetical protein